jgi:glycosyltransferase involved in cell wall biosynthesis
MPLVSILIPCHNAAPWLAATIESALAQTCPEKEIIVVDDGSTDASRDVARQFEARGVRVVTQTNTGASAARNHGLRLAHGDYVQFLDADDLLHPEKIASQLAVLATATAGTIASGPWAGFTDDPARAVFRPEPVWADSAPLDWLVRSWSGGGMFPPLVWLTPRAVLDAAGPWDESLSLDDDGEYFCRVLLRSHAIRFVPDARSLYRRHGGPRLSARRGLRAARSSFASNEQKARLALAAEDSPRVRHALACNWQRFAWEHLDEAPALAAEAHERSRAFDPALPPPRGPRAYRIAARLLGWRSARKLQLRARRLFRR